ncbi:hypothetical protein CY35_11G059300 [Sphagnum magellanicum]|nr:hypothetical protein CY35_11G059300 [Sphagnum magellanicum]
MTALALGTNQRSSSLQQQLLSENDICCETQEDQDQDYCSSSLISPHEIEEDLFGGNTRQRNEEEAAAATGCQLSVQAAELLLVTVTTSKSFLTCQAVVAPAQKLEKQESEEEAVGAQLLREEEEKKKKKLRETLKQIAKRPLDIMDIGWPLEKQESEEEAMGAQLLQQEEEKKKKKLRETLKQIVKRPLDIMDIGWPTDVEHIAHVTFDRCNGFQGLPQEYENEVPCPTPSASQSVFGVSAESMQCSYDLQGNMVPTLLLRLQKRLYEKGGLKVEGIFRINPENDHEGFVREQLNKGIVPSDEIDVHALASLIKTWFRELPKGVLDELSPGEVLRCRGEKETLALIKQLPSTEAALLDWALNLMADVAEEEPSNKMNARSIATIFAPNMTKSTVIMLLLLTMKSLRNIHVLGSRILPATNSSIVS